MLSFFPRDVLDEILDLIESVSEGFFLPTLASFADRIETVSSSKGVLEHGLLS